MKNDNNQRFAAEIGTLLLLGGAILVKASPQEQNDVIRARRFEVVGKDGKVRVEIAVDKEDTPHVRLLDAQGNERAVVQLSHDGFPELSLVDDASGAGVSLDVDKRAAGLSIYGTPSTTLDGGIANRSIGLRVYQSHEAGLSIADTLTIPSGHTMMYRSRLNAEVAENGSAFLTLASKKQAAHIHAHVSLNGQAGIDMYDSGNKRVWGAPTK